MWKEETYNIYDIKMNLVRSVKATEVNVMNSGLIVFVIHSVDNLVIPGQHFVVIRKEDDQPINK